MEKERGIPVQMLNDRDKVNRPNSQALEMDKGGLLVKHDEGRLRRDVGKTISAITFWTVKGSW